MIYQFESEEINRCWNCPCYDGDKECLVLYKSLAYGYIWDDKPDWCPLKEVKND